MCRTDFLDHNTVSFRKCILIFHDSYAGFGIDAIDISKHSSMHYSCITKKSPIGFVLQITALKL